MSLDPDPVMNSQGQASGFTAIKATVALVMLYLVSYSIYALYLHPLQTYPGPKLSAISCIPYWIACLKDGQVRWLTQLHNTYGAVVRFGPNDLSYTDSRAWKDICFVQKGKKENGKEVSFHAPRTNNAPSLIAHPNQVRHAALRRVFSEKALKAQEPLFRKYANLMVVRGREAPTIDMTELFNFATFDIMAEFAFGQSLSLLEHNKSSSWVAAIFQFLRVLPLIQMIECYPLAKKVFNLLEPKSIATMRYDHFRHTVMCVDKRLKEGSDQPDLWNLVLESDVLTLGEMHINAELFMTAGTETTASLLTGLTYYLVADPDKMKILTDEARGRVSRSEDITLEVLAGMEYLNACIREGLRVYPPVPSGIPREIAEGGNMVLGKWLPAGTRVSVHQAATYRSAANFRQVSFLASTTKPYTTEDAAIDANSQMLPFRHPDKFAPERWLDDPEYRDDNREAHQPFSVGPRNCIGMNMAWHEMRMLLAKLLFSFDSESDVGPDWRDQDVYVIWDRKPLMCRLKDVISPK